MRTIFYFVCAALSVLSCTGQTSPQKLASRLENAEREDALAMLDKAFDEADKVAAATQSTEQIALLSDGLFAELTKPGKPQTSYELAEAMLEREVKCTSLDPIDYKKIDYKRNLLNLNRPGFKLSDFDVIIQDGSQTRLSSLFTKRTLLFVYSGACSQCDRMLDEIRRSSFLRDSTLNLVSLFVRGGGRKS